jgi:hypothetical protein
VSARQTRFVRPTSDVPGNIRRALVTLIDTLEREQSEDSVDLSALNAAIAAAQLQINALLEQLEDIDLNGALTPQQEFELALVTQVDTILGSVSQLVVDSIKRSEKAAAAVIESLLKGRKNEIAIRVEQAARLTDREAFVSQISEFSAQIGLAQAQITEEIQARSDGDNVLASVDQQIISALNGNVAAVQILTESVNGIEARWGVAINQNGYVTGLIQLDGEATGSTFTIVANNLRVAQPGTAGGNPVPVFAIQNVNGTTKLALRGDMYADGAILARHISVSSLAAISTNFGSGTYSGVLQSASGSNGVLRLNFNTPEIRLTTS